VLDGKLVRGPVARSFALSVFVGALVVAAPLAALTLTAPHPAAAKASSGRPNPSSLAPLAETASAEVPADLPHIIARGVSASVATATAVIAQAPIKQAVQQQSRLISADGSTVSADNGTIIARSSSGATVTTYPPDAQGRRRVVAIAPNGATAISYADAAGNADARAVAVSRHAERAIELAIQLKALGISPEYIQLIRSSSPALRDADTDDVIAMRSVGVTPGYIRDLAREGYGNLDADDLEQARAVGVTPEYVRGIVASGVRPALDELIQLRAMNISPDELARVRASGVSTKVKIKSVLRSRSSAPPPPPAPPPSDPGDG
jgi:hypothetical protein